MLGLCVIYAFGISACAHKPRVQQPSKGHIDGQVGVPISQNGQPVNKPIASDIPKPITNTPYLPPPKPRAKEQTYSIVVYDTPVKEVLFAIARDSKLNVDIHPGIQGRVTLNAVDQTLPAILERLAKQVDLTYRIENNVLTINPDQPVLRSYKVDYVNMTRDTKGFIGAAAEISSTGQGASAGATGGGSSGSGANNSSRTSVTSEAKNHLWESLIQNIKDLLAETDKEVIVNRYGNTTVDEKQSNTAPQNQAAEISSSKSKAELQQSEYKTLLAANVIANAETGVISVRATNRQHEKVQEFIDRVMSSAKKQVLIEATIVEVKLSDSFKAGIDWSRLGNTASSNGFNFRQSLNNQTGLPTTVGSVNDPNLNVGLIAGYLNPVSSIGNIAASISLLKQFGDTKVLSSPKLMVLNNQTAVLKVVDNLVYFTIKSEITQNTSSVANTSNSLRSYTTTPNTIPVGVVMSVTPQINDGGAVNINVRPTISSLIRYVPDPNPDVPQTSTSGIPEIRVREMESLLQINSGNTAVLGGLMQDELQANSDRVPGLSEIPIAGNVFKGKDDFNRKTELVIFLRPTVIANASLESDELATYKQYLPSEQLKQKLEQDDER